ncbi:hypothetical protein TRFO_02456 [Tritrichomonas foetus]|uniref:Cyclin, N-terminal domain containing protein n=1 Tax=Tritrichomonas foetus TaxID=1144522 RepID=A0A1J4J907_9EUKA|nr:hypothetical protein TRFO_02456 [Tritrichomonas foetus]|eukprot:OHS93893.1 hypothetical protein TRFO_02456 [Tritrichomonas foetus]
MVTIIRMEENPNWNLPLITESWKLICDAGRQLKIPLSPTISTAMFYLHHYFEVSGQLDLTLFQIVILATFVSSKTEETFCKADDVIQSFVTSATTRDSRVLQILGTSLEELECLHNINSDDFEDFRKKLLDSELDFMTEMKWTFPNQNPFFVLSKWVSIIGKELGQMPKSLEQTTIDILSILYLFPDSIHIDIKDLAASALEYSWRKLQFSTTEGIPHWTKFIEYDVNGPVFYTLLERITNWENEKNSEKEEEKKEKRE